MPTATAEYRATVPRTVWMTARARNALRRRVFVMTVTVGAIVSLLVALVIIPIQARRTPAPAALTHEVLPDTAPLAAQVAQSARQLALADSSLARARTNAAAIRPPKVDSLSPVMAARRDTISAKISALETLLQRVEAAPLTASYRALGESPILAGDARVHALLDSLSEVERERESFGATGGADPVFVALTSRATDIGRAIQTIAVEKRASLQHDMIALAPVVTGPSPEELAAADTATRTVQRASAEANYHEALARLAAARQRRHDLEDRITAEKQAAALKAPPLALLAAALVLGAVFGFGIALMQEIRNPRVADEHEAERVTGTRVLATIVPAPRPRERRRRKSDREAPPLLDPGAAGHQLVYLHAATSSPPLLMVTVVGDDAGVTGAVATNFAAIAAEEARNTVLLDLDSAHSAVASTLHIRPRPGMADVVARGAELSEIIVPTMTGRDRSVDVVPSGISSPEIDAAAVTRYFDSEGDRLTRHYDAVVLVASEKQALGGLPASLPIADVIFCARVGKTRLSTLRTSIDALAKAGARPIGIVLWKAPFPRTLTPDQVVAGPAPVREAPREPEPVST